jgi:hypothetical protein
VKVLLEEETIEGDALQAILNAEPGKESEELIKAEKKHKAEKSAGEGGAEKPSAQKPPQPGLAWEAPSRLDPHQRH